MRLPASPFVRDVVLAVVLTVVGQVELLAAGDRTQGPLVVQHLAFAVMTGATAWRRRAPLAATVAAAAGLVVQTAAGDAPVAAGYVAILVLLVSLGYHSSLRFGLIGLGVTLLAGLSYELFGNELVVADVVVNVLLMTGAWLLAHRVRMHADARIEAEVLRDRAARDAALAERARISRDLHDSVAHALTVMTLQAGAVRERVSDEDAAAALGAIGDAGRRALADMHAFLRLLGPDGEGPESPTLLDLDEVVAAARAAGLEVVVATTGDLASLPASVSTTGYRIVQEAVTNALKHGRATRAEVRVRVDGGALCVEVEDDGRVTAPALAGAGRGLAGLAERVGLLGGRLTAARGPRGGWQLSASLPLGQGAA